MVRGDGDGDGDGECVSPHLHLASQPEHVVQEQVLVNARAMARMVVQSPIRVTSLGRIAHRKPFEVKNVLRLTT